MQDELLLDRKGVEDYASATTISVLHQSTTRRQWISGKYRISKASTRLKSGHIVHLFVETNVILLTRRRLSSIELHLLPPLFRRSLSLYRHAEVTASPDAYV